MSKKEFKAGNDYSKDKSNKGKPSALYKISSALKKEHDKVKAKKVNIK